MSLEEDRRSLTGLPLGHHHPHGPLAPGGPAAPVTSFPFSPLSPLGPYTTKKEKHLILYKF